MKESWQGIVDFIDRWGTRLLAALVTVAVIALWLGFWNDWSVVAPLASAVLLGLVWLMVAQQATVESLSGRVDRTLEHVSGQLLSLDSCQRDLVDKLSRLSPSQPIELRHLGLDMNQAWGGIQQLLRGLPGSREVDLKILIISPQTAKEGWAKSLTVQSWITSAASSLQVMEASVPELAAHHRRLRLEVRGYREFPYIHGFAIARPISARYFAFCRWESSSIVDWGKDRYRRIEGQPSAPSLFDLAEIYDGAFDRLWEHGADEVLVDADLGREAPGGPPAGTMLASEEKA